MIKRMLDGRAMAGRGHPLIYMIPPPPQHPYSSIELVLLHNSGFCNDCSTKDGFHQHRTSEKICHVSKCTPQDPPVCSITVDLCLSYMRHKTKGFCRKPTAVPAWLEANKCDICINNYSML
jgi:hypothetical protein